MKKFSEGDHSTHYFKHPTSIRGRLVYACIADPTIGGYGKG